MPTEEVAFRPESNGEPFRGFSQESDMITGAFSKDLLAAPGRRDWKEE